MGSADAELMTTWQRAVFLAEMEVTANVMFACAAADVTYAQALAERDRNPLFEVEWRSAVALANYRFVSRVRPPAPAVPV